MCFIQKPVKTVRLIADFLDKPLTTSQIFDIIQSTTFEQMKKNPLSNYSWWNDLGLRDKNESDFLRKGSALLSVLWKGRG